MQGGAAAVLIFLPVFTNPRALRGQEVLQHTRSFELSGSTESISFEYGTPPVQIQKTSANFRLAMSPGEGVWTIALTGVRQVTKDDPEVPSEVLLGDLFFGGDRTNCYSLIYFERGDDAMENRGRGITPGPAPNLRLYPAQHLWLVYLSGLAGELNQAAMMPPWPIPLPGTNSYLRFKASRFDEPPAFLKALVYENPGYYFGHRDARFAYPEPFDSGFKAGELVIEEIGEHLGMRIPLRFHIVGTALHMGQGRAELYTAFRYAAEVDQVRPVRESVKPIPQSRGPTVVHDARIPVAPHRPFLTYTQENNEVLGVGDPKLKAAFDSEFEKYHRKKKRNSALSAIIAILLLLPVGVMLFNLKRKSRTL